MPSTTESNNVTIYTDGSCIGNPGNGGWGFVCVRGDSVECFSGSEKATTNNRMELTAAIEALKFCKDKININTAIIYTDSMYVKNGITTWITQWKKKNWRGTNGPVKNQDLWLILDQLNSCLKIEWRWVKAHDINKYNNLADQLANKAARM